jgi:hypothetical protein
MAGMADAESRLALVVCSASTSGAGGDLYSPVPEHSGIRTATVDGGFGIEGRRVLCEYFLVDPHLVDRRNGRSVRDRTVAPTTSEFEHVRPDLPFVTNSALTFLEMDRYEDPALVARLYYLVGRESALRYDQSNLTEGLPTLKKYFPIRATVSQYFGLRRGAPALPGVGRNGSVGLASAKTQNRRSADHGDRQVRYRVRGFPIVRN